MILNSKEDPVKPIHIQYVVKSSGRTRHTFYCGACGEFKQRVTMGDVYCRNCGTKINWRI